MWRTVASILIGLVAWTVVATILNFGLRAARPGYHAAEATLQFTMAMKIGRLSLAALASLVAGATVRAVAPASPAAPWIAGAIVLALFLPVHYQLWSKFPAWYHLTFLLSIVPLFGLGAALWSRTEKSDAMQR
jgi:hypothetical protein